MQMSWTRLRLLLILSACATSPAAHDVSGVWVDERAAFTVCGETLPVAVGLELAQAGSSLQGSFVLQGNRSAFSGEVAQGRVTGAVRGDGGAGLDAALTLEEGRLTGIFTAVEEIGCTAGGASVAVYEVALTRR